MPSSYTIGEHYEAFVRTLVDSGRYASASEVIRDALRLLEEEQIVRDIGNDELRRLIQEGLESGDAGILDMDEVIEAAKRRKATRDAA